MSGAFLKNSSESSNNTGRNTKHVTSACFPCRKAKAKCDGSKPCSRCSNKLLSCDYQEIIDGRSQRGDLKRKLEELEQESSVLRGIIGYIRSTDEEAASQLIALIRSNVSVSEVHQCIQQRLQEPEAREQESYRTSGNPNTQVTQITQEQNLLPFSENQSVGHPQRTVFDVARLVDDPPWRISAQPWTNVIDEDNLVSHLVSLWLCWRSPHEIIVAEKYFIKGMQSGNFTSRYCSKFLVSCVLAFGCFFSDFSETKPQRGQVSVLGHRLMNEATKLLEDEGDEVSLTKIQGLSILCNLVAMAGEDVATHPLVSRTAEMYKQLSEKLMKPGTKLTEDELIYQNVLNITCWGIANYLTATYFILMKPSQISLPSTPLLSDATSTDFFEASWYCYPRDLDPIPSHADEIFEGITNLQILVHELSQLLFETSQAAFGHVAGLLQLREKLKAWHSNLPEHLRSSASSTPAVLTMDAWYHGILITTNNALEKSYKFNPEFKEIDIEANNVKAALCIVEDCRIHWRSWGTERLNTVLAQAIVYALQCLTREMLSPEYDEEITDLCIYLRKLGRRIPRADALLRTFILEARLRGKSLPAKTQHLFEDFVNDSSVSLRQDHNNDQHSQIEQYS